MLPNIRTLLVVSFIGFAANWQFGYQITYINTAADDFFAFANRAYKNDNSVELDYSIWSKQWSLIVSSFYPGTFLGFVLVPFLIRRIGIRRSFLYSGYLAMIGSLIQLFIRFTANISCSLCLLPLFIIEACPPAHRPFLSSLQQVFQALSTLIGLMVGSSYILPLGEYKIEILELFSLFPMCVFIIFLTFLPDTPLYILESQNDEKVTNDSGLYKSVEFYYGDLEELNLIREEAYERLTVDFTTSECDTLRKPENIKGLLVGSLAAISFAFTADDIIDSYSSQLLDISMDTSTTSKNALPELITIFLGVLLLVTSIVGAFLIDRFGRKKLLICGLIGTAFSNTLAAIGTYSGSVVILTMGFSFTKIFIGFGAGAPAWFLTSELVSPRVTCICQSISTGCLLMTTGVVVLLFLQIKNLIGGPLTIVVVAVVPALLIAGTLILLLPETKERSTSFIARSLNIRMLSGLGATTNDGETADEDSWLHAANRPPYLRLMSAKSYASYGSLRSPRYSLLHDSLHNQ